DQAKERLRVILQVLTGELTAAAAQLQLGVSPSRFHELRRQALEGALARLTPAAAGRPPKEPEHSEREQELLRRIDDLEVDLQAAFVRTEIALVMPHVLKPLKGRTSKKNGRDGT